MGSHLTVQPSREDIAKLEIGVTAIRPGLARALTAIFLAVILGVPALQMGYEQTGSSCANSWKALSATWRAAPGSVARRALTVNRKLLRNLTTYERNLEEDSWLTRILLPPAQRALLHLFGVGNEKVYRGRDGWLFYRPEIDLLTGPGYLEPGIMRRRIAAAPEWQTPPHPNPIPAILDFHEQLRRRGMDLVVMPVPVKPAIHPERFVRGAQGQTRPLDNVSGAALLDALRQRGVRVFDPAPILKKAAGGTNAPQYLATDTHWRPEAMERVAEELARELSVLMQTGPHLQFRRGTETVDNEGDLARMLTLPPGAGPAREGVVVHPVFTDRNELWRSAEDAAVLVLGDSFCNIYSLPALGWGAGAGFAEQLSFYLGAPVDRLVRNDEGAQATRQMLSRELARGRDRLAGKRVVVWQFTAREWAQGDWALVDLTLGAPAPPRFVQVPPGSEWTVTGQVASVSAVPRPGSAPYRDHILSVLLTDLSGLPGRPDGEETVLAYAWSMKDNRLAPAAYWRNGQQVVVRLRAWSDLSGALEAIQRSELDDAALRLEEPCWADEADAGR